MLKIKSKAERIIELAKEIAKEDVENLIEEDDFGGIEISQKDLYDGLVKMIKWTQQAQKLYAKSKSAFSPKSWAKENATIKYALPRQSGHTTFAQKLFYKFFKKPIYITENMEMCRGAGFTMKEQNVGSMYHIKNGKFKGLTPDAIIVDCASFFSQKDIEMIYDEFSCIAYSQPNFIFLFLE